MKIALSRLKIVSLNVRKIIMKIIYFLQKMIPLLHLKIVKHILLVMKVIKRFS